MFSQNGRCTYSDRGRVEAPEMRASSASTYCSAVNASVKRSAVGYDVYLGPKPSYLRISAGSNDRGVAQSVSAACGVAIPPSCLRLPQPALSQINRLWQPGAPVAIDGYLTYIMVVASLQHSMRAGVNDSAQI